MCIIQRFVVVIDEKKSRQKPAGQYYKSDFNFPCFLPFPFSFSLFSSTSAQGGISYVNDGVVVYIYINVWRFGCVV